MTNLPEHFLVDAMYVNPALHLFTSQFLAPFVVQDMQLVVQAAKEISQPEFTGYFEI